jgi:hypothetical protein
MWAVEELLGEAQVRFDEQKEWLGGFKTHWGSTSMAAS